MIKTFFKKFVKRANHGASGAARSSQEPRIYSAAEHGIDPQWIDDRARQVVQTLQQGGYRAYIVGGAVRDLLLDLRPKDFDVSTDATPEQVKKLFKRAFIIGRRFRIVHVVFGGGPRRFVVEVSTFRAYFENPEEHQVRGNEQTSRKQLAGMARAVGVHGRVLRDNVWGSQHEDAARRDLSINGMYYDPQTQELLDYHAGLEDIRGQRLRMIGEPMQRYRQDPVRILRVLRFGAKLASRGFVIDPATAGPLQEAAPLLQNVPQSRLFDEALKMLQTGHAQATVQILREHGLDRGLHPLLDLLVQRADQPLLALALQDTDERVVASKPVAASFLMACLLWPDVCRVWQDHRAAGEHEFPALQAAIDQAFDAHVGEVSGRGKLGADMREIWVMQARFDRRRGKRPYALVRQRRFRAGLDFLALRERCGELKPGLHAWWDAFSQADAERQQAMLKGESAADGQSDGNGQKRKRRRRRKPRSARGAAAGGEATGREPSSRA